MNSAVISQIMQLLNQHVAGAALPHQPVPTFENAGWAPTQATTAASVSSSFSAMSSPGLSLTQPLSPHLTPLSDSSEDPELAALKEEALRSKADRCETEEASATLETLLNTEGVGLDVALFEQEGTFSPGPEEESAAAEPVHAIPPRRTPPFRQI